jgi:hypothetical protein
MLLADMAVRAAHGSLEQREEPFGARLTFRLGPARIASEAADMAKSPKQQQEPEDEAVIMERMKQVAQTPTINAVRDARGDGAATAR